jgi:thioredoxin-like negative regulator of GroEL
LRSPQPRRSGRTRHAALRPLRHAGKLKVVKVNVDEEPALAARFDARSIPLLVVLDDGREVDRVVGALPRPALEARLASVLG